MLTALEIPKDPYKQPGVDSLSLSLRNEAYAFIVAHELGHVLFRHKGYAEVTKAQARADEVQSDSFALDVLARTATQPLGAVFYFQAQIYRFRHRGEFKNNEAWNNYLLTVATHPVAVDRLKAMARHISGPLAVRRGSEKKLWKDIGSILIKLAGLLDDEDLPRCIAKFSAEGPWHVLKHGASDPSWSLEAVCRGG